MEDQIEVRLANDGDIDQINAFYNRIYGKNRTKEQFIWEFNSSPAGKALYIIAEHGTKIVGTQCAIPYYVINGKNETILSAKSEDTLVDPEYRGLYLTKCIFYSSWNAEEWAFISFGDLPMLKSHSLNLDLKFLSMLPWIDGIANQSKPIPITVNLQRTILSSER